MAAALIVNGYLTGARGEWTALGMILASPAILGFFGSLASLDYTVRKDLFYASLIALVLVVGLTSIFEGTTIGVISEIFIGPLILAAGCTTLVVLHDSVVDWYFERESPEERLLDE